MDKEDLRIPLGADMNQFLIADSDERRQEVLNNLAQKLSQPGGMESLDKLPGVERSTRPIEMEEGIPVELVKVK